MFLVVSGTHQDAPIRELLPGAAVVVDVAAVSAECAVCVVVVVVVVVVEPSPAVSAVAGVVVVSVVVVEPSPSSISLRLPPLLRPCFLVVVTAAAAAVTAAAAAAKVCDHCLATAACRCRRCSWHRRRFCVIM